MDDMKLSQQEISCDLPEGTRNLYERCKVNMEPGISNYRSLRVAKKVRAS